MNPYELLTSHNKFHINLGLERIQKILNLLDNPQDNYKVIHLAGTNGKGSTSKIINEILIEHYKNTSKKIGLFTSPHLFNYEERIKINNADIDSKIFEKLINEIDLLAVQNNIELSEFELLTAVAFYYFAKEKVEYLILETGLGGLFDATNVVKPLVEVITAIDFDHSERLGKTIEEIAFQKAGIIKEKTRAVVLKENFGYSVIEKVAKEKKASLFSPEVIEIIFDNSKNYALIDNEKIEFNLWGKHQGENLALALEAVKKLDINIEKLTIRNALKNVKWPFRLQYFQDKNLLIDGAHNPSGVRVLRNYLDENYNNVKKNIIFGCLKNKNYIEMLKILIKPEDEFYFCEFDYPNALKYEDLPQEFAGCVKKVLKIKDVIKLIQEDKNLKICCGSLYMLGNIFIDFK